jgi:hypothetical protein
MKYICKKFNNHQIKKCFMFAISLSSCSRYNANFKLDLSYLCFLHERSICIIVVHITRSVSGPYWWLPTAQQPIKTTMPLIPRAIPGRGLAIYRKLSISDI